jgi:diguanylate cyclase (GGDEF)-like protein
VKKSHGMDTLSLISIQHELAMNIGLNPQLVPMVRHVMRVCLRRLSVRRVYLFMQIKRGEEFPKETLPGPEGSFYFAKPANSQVSILSIPKLANWLGSFFKHNQEAEKVTLIKHEELYYHLYPLAGNGVFILERAHSPLPEILVGALIPVFDRLCQACEAAVNHEQIIHEVERRRVAERRIEHLAFHDDLTGLPNRRYLLNQIKRLVNGAKGDEKFNALVYFGLDHFSDINESLGYQIGDAVLTLIAERVFTVQNVSKIVARLDGDEFGVLISSLTSDMHQARNEAVEWTRLLSAQIEEPCEINGLSLRMAASAGIVLFKGDEEVAEEILSHGRSALRQAKSLGRNTIHHHNAAMDAEIENRLSLDYEMRSALKTNEFRLWLQPQVDDEGRLIGAETLIRWYHPEKGIIPPGQFISMAEKSGFIVPLSDWVLAQACHLVKVLDKQSALPKNGQLAVNLSAKHFHQPDFVNRVLNAISRTGIDADRIELELTEHTLLDNVEEAIEKMVQLRDAGVHIAIDDFGTGYSSLAYLRRLPINRVKVDQAFVANIDTNPDDQAIVEVIFSIARHFGMSVIAEGVERQDCLSVLKQMGFKQFQGYLFHRPMPLEEFICFGSGGSES